jgi:hypothetical protein
MRPHPGPPQNAEAADRAAYASAKLLPAMTTFMSPTKALRWLVTTGHGCTETVGFREACESMLKTANVALRLFQRAHCWLSSQLARVELVFLRCCGCSPSQLLLN